MASTIQVERTDQGEPMTFKVQVEEADSSSQHTVTMATGAYEALTGGDATPEETIDGAFRFLLDREPKEQILATFDVTVISKYFPGFEDEIESYLK